MKRSFNIYLIAVLTIFLAFLLSGCNSGNRDEKSSTPKQKVQIADESLYQLEGEWHNQHGDTLQLNKLKGKIPVMTMMFTRCDFSCPRVVADLKKIEKQVPEDKKDQVVFVLVSFDSERDTPDKLKEFAKKMKLNDKWLLLHGDEEQVRELSMLLDVKYKKQPDGSFSHSNGITLLDTGGSIAAHVEGLGVDPKPIVSRFNDL
ncbi:MAG TPA: SCO family protein [Sphingobacteriaceae bacterium]